MSYKILFVCKFNRFRSKVAEALLKHYVMRKDVEIKSAGILIDFMRPFMAQEVVQILNQMDVLVANQKSEIITEEAIKWADKIIIVADNVYLGKFPPEKIEIWPIKDASEHDPGSILISINEIEKNIQEFAKRLNSKQR